MVINSKDFEMIIKNTDDFACRFAKWILKNVKKSAQKDFYILKKQNKVVPDYFTINQLLEMFRVEINKDKLKQ
jgi:hypothetical protein